jgi:hypothetical protein
VSSGGEGILCQTGDLLLMKMLRVSGLDQGLSGALSRWRRPRAVNNPGKIITDLAVALVLGGDRFADVAMLRNSPEVFGPVASDPMASRLVAALAEAGSTNDGRGGTGEPAMSVLHRGNAGSNTAETISALAGSPSTRSPSACTNRC